jgi:hypothetical protein
MKTLNAWLVTIIGVLLLLPLVGVSTLGTATSGIAGWVIALAVLLMGILKIAGK